MTQKEDKKAATGRSTGTMKATKTEIFEMNNAINERFKDNPLTLKEAAHIMMQAALQLCVYADTEVVRAEMSLDGFKYDVTVKIEARLINEPVTG